MHSVRASFSSHCTYFHLTLPMIFNTSSLQFFIYTCTCITIKLNVSSSPLVHKNMKDYCIELCILLLHQRYASLCSLANVRDKSRTLVRESVLSISQYQQFFFSLSQSFDESYGIMSIFKAQRSIYEISKVLHSDFRVYG